MHGRPVRHQRSRPVAGAAVVLVAVLLAGCGSGDDVGAAGTASPVGASEPAVSEPAVSEPAVSEPAVSEPAVSEPAASEPAASEPADSAPTEQSPQPPADAEQPDATRVTIEGFAYEMPDEVAPGAEVTVVNNDSEVHSFTARDAGIDLNVLGGETGTFTAPQEPGEYRVVCIFHSNMVATLVVSD